MPRPQALVYPRFFPLKLKPCFGTKLIKIVIIIVIIIIIIVIIIIIIIVIIIIVIIIRKMPWRFFTTCLIAPSLPKLTCSDFRMTR